MIDIPSEKRVVQFAPRPHEFQTRVREMAQNTSKVFWSAHARERMDERDIPIRIALSVIREGIIMGPIEPGRSAGEWKAKITKNVPGRRDVGVVVLLIRDDHIRVKTVEWEDM